MTPQGGQLLAPSPLARGVGWRLALAACLAVLLWLAVGWALGWLG